MRGKRFCAAALVALLGGLLPGCLWDFTGEDTGQICAISVGGDEHCVSSSDDPAVAWDAAAADGSLPIQMWAKWPEETTIDDLVRSRDKLHRWFDDINKAGAYVRGTKGSAESYRASLDGRLGQLLREVKAHQAALLAEKPVDAVGDF